MRTIHYIPSAHTLNERALETGPMKSSAVQKLCGSVANKTVSVHLS